MSLQVNFTTHGHDLKAAYEAILNPSDPKIGDNWALFGYDKGTNDLKVIGRGSRGLEELEDEFVDGKIQYAFVRIVDPNSQLNKFILIAWCGDGVPESKKGLFNSHLSDVARFLKGYHLQINARSEADVTPAQILKRVNEGSGSKYSFHKETYEAEKIRPLQSAYKRTEIPDIAALQRNPTKPEPAPKHNVGASKPFGSSTSSSTFTSQPARPDMASSSSTSAAPPLPKPLGRSWPPPASYVSPSSDAAPAVSSKPTSVERSWKSGGGSSYSASSGSSFNKVAPPSSLLSYGNSSNSGPNEPTMNKAQQIRLEREAREKEERARIEKEIKNREDRERQAGDQSSAQKQAEEKRLREQKEQQDRERELERSREQSTFEAPRGGDHVRQERLTREKEERERAEAEDNARSAREAFKAREQGQVMEQANQHLEQEQQRKQQQRALQEQQDRRRKEEEAEERERHQRMQQQEDEERFLREEDEKRRLEDEEVERSRIKRLAEEEREEAERERHRQQEQRERDEQESRERQQQQDEEDEREKERQLQEEVGAAAAQSVALGADALIASSEHPDLAGGSVSAIVLYAYDKSEANEMSLIEGEIITNVTELDVGWWSGESEDGTRSGLFPANYVEIIEHAHDQGQDATEHYDHSHTPVPQDHSYGHDQGAENERDLGYDQLSQAPPSGSLNKQTAVALYEYSAGEPNEISFEEGEVLVEIDFVTEDWWSGKSKDGTRAGLFPANYVELIQH